MEPLPGAKKFSHTGSGTTSATATESTPTSQRIYITDIVASSDKVGALVQLKGSGTPYLETYIPVTSTSTPYTVTIHLQTPIILPAEYNATAEVDGDAVCYITFTGYVAN